MLNGFRDMNTRWSNTMADAPLAMQISELGVWRSRISRLATLDGSKSTDVSNATPAPMPTMNAPAIRKFVTRFPPPPPSPPWFGPGGRGEGYPRRRFPKGTTHSERHGEARSRTRTRRARGTGRAPRREDRAGPHRRPCAPRHRRARGPRAPPSPRGGARRARGRRRKNWRGGARRGREASPRARVRFRRTGDAYARRGGRHGGVRQEHRRHVGRPTRALEWRRRGCVGVFTLTKK